MREGPGHKYWACSLPESECLSCPGRRLWPAGSCQAAYRGRSRQLNCVGREILRARLKVIRDHPVGRELGQRAHLRDAWLTPEGCWLPELEPVGSPPSRGGAARSGSARPTGSQADVLQLRLEAWSSRQGPALPPPCQRVQQLGGHAHTEVEDAILGTMWDVFFAIFITFRGRGIGATTREEKWEGHREES